MAQTATKTATQKRRTQGDAITVSRRELRAIVHHEVSEQLRKLEEQFVANAASPAKPRAVFGALKGRGYAGAAVLEPMSDEELREWGAL